MPPQSIPTVLSQPELGGATGGPRDDRASSSWEDELFRKLAVSAPAGLVVVDPEGTVRLRNAEAARILADVDRLPAALLAVLDRDANGAAAGETVVLEQGLRRLEVE